MGNSHGIHMMDPKPEGEEGHRDQCRDDDPVTGKRSAGEDGEDGGNRARGRQEDDVDLRMPEQPEQMLPEQRIAAARGIEEGQPERPLKLEENGSEDEGRESHKHHRCDNEHIPGEDRHLVERHAGGAQLEDRHDELDRRREGGDLDEGDAEQPDVGVDAG